MRSRNIKPGFFKNEDLCVIDPIGRLLFEGLWCIADREGRLQDRPRKIWAEVLPYDPYNGEELLWQLHDKGFIVRYEVGERRFIWIPTFAEHQNPHTNETASFIPDVSMGCKMERHGSKSLAPSTGALGLDSLIPGFLEKPLSEPSSDVPNLSVPKFSPTPTPIRSREVSQVEKLVNQYAPLIHKRHVARKCSLKVVRDRLFSILRKTKECDQVALLETIDRNHQAWCKHEDWNKDGGQFCPGLDKWLNLTAERYVIGPPARAAPLFGKDPAFSDVPTWRGFKRD